MKKVIFILSSIILLLVLAGCQSKVNMDELAEDNLYHYQNRGFGFFLDLPPEFIYYQTQRIARRDYTDIEFFVPTNDRSYPTQVPGYGRAVTVRVFNTNEWQKILAGQSDAERYEWLSEQKNRVYTIKFWDKPPADWQDKWSEEMRQNIKNSFKLK